ncbi:hypothetical protein D210916BOD24_21690 [Alteromonas sp. D210916BOD_24]|uniref:YfiR/HmsC family protein n=1 Tax=Alteromonas sp. D210916BOD_24 TaxID=3157618 RepID=UPI00399D1A3A
MSFAEDFDEPTVKAAFIFNFIKHTTWPDESSKDTFTIGVYKNKPFFDLLASTMSGQSIRNKPLYVINVNSIKQLQQVDVAVVFLPPKEDIADIASLLRETATLLITDRSHNKKDVMINFIFNTVRNKLAFEVNRSNIVFEQLKISDELLLLGGSELDVAKLYRETERALQQMKRDEITMHQSINSLNAELRDTNAKLRLSEQTLQNNNHILLQRKDELDTKEKTLSSLREKVEAQNRALKETNAHLQLLTQQKNNEVTRHQQISKKNNEEIKQQEMQIRNLAEKASEFRSRIDEQVSKLRLLEQEIATKNITIEDKNTKLMMTSAVMLFVGFLLVIIIVLYVRMIRTSSKLEHTLIHLKETQSQLVQSEKMASLGLLTAGISHEINTPLGIVITSLSIIADNAEQMDEKISAGKLTKHAFRSAIDAIKQSLEISNSSLKRVTHLISNFKQVAADHFVEEPRNIHLAQYINEFMVTLASKLNQKNINFTPLPTSDLVINTIPGALTQVLTNFVSNAIDHAFAEQLPSKPEISFSIVDDKEQEDVTIVYTDNGCGMPKEVLENIYEPFYTTKRGEGGTGLGMHIVFNIVHKMLQGEITISSEEHVGTQIKLIIPRELRGQK